MCLRNFGPGMITRWSSLIEEVLLVYLFSCNWLVLHSNKAKFLVHQLIMPHQTFHGVDVKKLSPE